MAVEIRERAAVDSAWLMEVLQSGGYEVQRGSTDAEAMVAKHPARPNVILKIHPELGLITITHFWHLKKAGFGQHKDLLEKLNKANSESWRDTFYIDAQGDLAVSSYITLADHLAPEDVTSFLEREGMGFSQVVATSALKDHVQ
jgi:hypothetical protein